MHVHLRSGLSCQSIVIIVSITFCIFDPDVSLVLELLLFQVSYGSWMDAQQSLTLAAFITIVGVASVTNHGFTVLWYLLLSINLYLFLIPLSCFISCISFGSLSDAAT